MLFSTAAACVHLPACPEHGGPSWSEWRSPHFRILTDVGDEIVAERLATQMEQFRAAIVAAAWRNVPEPSGQVEVIALRSAFETEAVLTRYALGRFVWFPGGSFILVSATEQFGRAKTLKHEMVHALMHQFGLDRNAPIWFGEGIAEYLATTDFDEDKSKVTFGSPDSEYLRAVYEGGLASWDELWAADAVGRDKVRQVATSWLLVHYLFNHEPERFGRFQNGLAGAKDAQAWWLQVFPDLGADALDDRLSVYSEQGQYLKYALHIPRTHFSFVQRGVPDAEVHAILGMLHWSAFRSDPTARSDTQREIGEALRLDPTNLRARFVQRCLLGEDAGDLPTAQALTQAYPNDVRAWLILALAHALGRHAAEAKVALDRARRLGYQDRDELAPAVAAPY